MKLIFELNKSNLNLAKEEIIYLEKDKSFKFFDNYLLIESEKDYSKRLGFSHRIFEFLFKSNKSKLNEKIEKYDWDSLIKKTFCVRIKNDKYITEKNLSSLIWKNLKKPNVNLKNPDTIIFFIFNKEEVYCCRFITDIDKSYLSRKAHMRPKLHPSSLDPRLARVCINLTGLKNGKILDPFCGSGGILIEAGFMGFNITGYDLFKKQIEYCKVNLMHYGINKFNIKQRDSSTIEKKFDAIVTDLPYGKNSKGKNLDELYLNFLNSAHQSTKRMVVIFPSWSEYKKIIKITKWKIKNEFEIYIHKSLTRYIVVLN
ncbi:methyltransferase domain-containing protein [archaeon]|jgi:tRNA (guanine10-N2)-dimethyltransferase|nr:methyltransferase domain-containing protein [archaeon]MBT4646811.1 methyltransferase domain-containing protein [archaeon]MBT6821487.1 methyltransferase domain-containing protein [archaeon]MBT7392969.1 methyltransferase domain-containing protein [archaeon]